MTDPNLNRCVGWAQCSKCPRPDRDSRAPPGAERSPCAPHPVHSCPVTGAHCPPAVQCCSPCGVDCTEFMPFKCPPMPAINCAPNLPPSGWAVLGWKPSPAALRADPKTQYPSAPSMVGKPTVQRRPCEARCLDVTARPMTLRYVPERPPLSSFESFPCNATPNIADYSTCSRLGDRRLAERVDFKYTFPGYEGTTSGRHVTCNPCLPCFERTAVYNSGLTRRPRTFNMATVPPLDN